jgi:aquaporin NIP
MLLVKKLLAEFLGTLTLVFFGAGSIIINSMFPETIGHLGIALSFGAVVFLVIQAFGELSGAHINPAVTLSFWLAKNFPGKHIAGYLTAQISGAIAASAILYALFPEATTTGATHPAGTIMQSFLLEFILSFILMLIILRVATGNQEQGLMAGLAIAGTVFIEALVAGPVCGASMNPARSIGPAIFEGNLTDLWVYIAAPILGMISAVPIWKILKN